MKVAIWDTYVTKSNGSIMHFDIVVPMSVDDPNIIYSYGQHYLQTKNLVSLELSSKECKFCHLENASEIVLVGIERRGYYIIELQNCT